MRSQPIQGILVLVAILGGIFGVLGFFMGFSEAKIRGVSQETPREVTATELYDHGPGDNAHIRLKLYALSDNYVTSMEDNRWTGVWLAVYPSEVEKDIPPKLILRSMDVKNVADLEKLASEPELTGILLTSAPWHGADQNDEMKKAWPGVDWDHVMMVQVGRGYPSAAYVNGFMGGGICLVLLAIVCGVGACFVKK